jgi:magnesium-transporting ATPase (P-type)
MCRLDLVIRTANSVRRTKNKERTGWHAMANDRPQSAGTTSAASGDGNAKPVSVEDQLKTLQTSTSGLTGDEAKQRLEKYGPNAIVAKEQSLLRKLLAYFWGPIPWMIEVAAVLSLLVRHWIDFAIILVLLLYNAGIGFWQERKAANALAALKKGLAPKAHVKRDGAWSTVDAATLVPGDVVRLRLGEIVPADVTLIEGDYISIDQAALTGESLPVTKKVGDTAYSGSIAKQGEMVAVVTGTGGNTFFGRTAKLVATAGAKSHSQQAVMRIGDFLIITALALSRLDSRGHARSALGHHGPRRLGTLQEEGHRLASTGDRRDGWRRRPVLGQDRHLDQEPIDPRGSRRLRRRECRGLHSGRCPGVQERG